jgi:hypothetical protein
MPVHHTMSGLFSELVFLSSGRTRQRGTTHRKLQDKHRVTKPFTGRSGVTPPFPPGRPVDPIPEYRRITGYIDDPRFHPVTRIMLRNVKPYHVLFSTLKPCRVFFRSIRRSPFMAHSRRFRNEKMLILTLFFSTLLLGCGTQCLRPRRCGITSGAIIPGKVLHHNRRAQGRSGETGTVPSNTG